MPKKLVSDQKKRKRNPVDSDGWGSIGSLRQSLIIYDSVSFSCDLRYLNRNSPRYQTLFLPANTDDINT